MNEGKIPVRYAKALFESALNQNLLDQVYSDMQFIAGVCKNDEMKEVLRSPIILPSDKRKILHALFEKNIHPLTLAMIDLMTKNGREAWLPSIARIFSRKTLEFQGITEPNLTTAVPVKEEVKKHISLFIESHFKTKVRLTESVDPDIIGGFVLKINDYFIDASIRTRLKKIKQNLSGGIKR